MFYNHLKPGSHILGNSLSFLYFFKQC
uniref:Uncharacterized protein n=1 Tax=Anguilla anguilla TaxID=7936 RepID=A0A0E9SZP4_ANGAN